MSIVENMRNHVNHRGGPTIQNSAWTMMLDAADLIDTLHAKISTLIGFPSDIFKRFETALNARAIQHSNSADYTTNFILNHFNTTDLSEIKNELEYSLSCGNLDFPRDLISITKKLEQWAVNLDNLQKTEYVVTYNGKSVNFWGFRNNLHYRQNETWWIVPGTIDLI